MLEVCAGCIYIVNTFYDVSTLIQKFSALNRAISEPSYRYREAAQRCCSAVADYIWLHHEPEPTIRCNSGVS
ncbi:MAG: hypothetical protein HC827_09955 [Cyanobacteria bacterium RM1_2_2]|nr:hypothetical protein [Cyanobacteria bacterium RM1_2_2]